MTNKTLVRIRVWIRAWIKIYIRTRNYYRKDGQLWKRRAVMEKMGTYGKDR